MADFKLQPKIHPGHNSYIPDIFYEIFNAIP